MSDGPFTHFNSVTDTKAVHKQVQRQSLVARHCSPSLRLCFLFRLYRGTSSLCRIRKSPRDLGNFQSPNWDSEDPARITRTARNSFTRTGRSSRRLLRPHHSCRYGNNPITRAVESACHRNGTERPEVCGRHGKKRSTLKRESKRARSPNQ
jgi:hypothetical protein